MRGETKRITNARVITDDGVIERGGVETADGVITRVLSEPGPSRPGDIDLAGAWLAPGFLDLHVHPDVPHSPADLRSCVETLSRELLAIGTTGILWTLGNMPFEQLLETAAALRDILADPPEPCAVIGIHSEGPYISPASCGAFDARAIGTPAELPLEKLFEAAGPALKYLSLSPDVPGAVDVVRECVRRGVRVGMGHTLAGVEALQRGLDAGARSVIHTFNNTPDYPMKEPGVRGVTVDEFGMSRPELTSEVICDGIHVDPVLVRALAAAKGPDGLMIVTDSIGGGRSMREGERITGQVREIVVQGGVGRNTLGGMSGSALTMERAFRNFVRFTGASMPDTVRVTSLNAARFLGLDGERGRIRPGCRADFAVLDNALNPVASLMS